MKYRKRKLKFKNSISLFELQILKKGKKIKVNNILRDVLFKLKLEYKVKKFSNFRIFHKALINAKPLVNLSKLQLGGIVYKIPIPCGPKRSKLQGVLWLLQLVREGVFFQKELIKVLVETYENKGPIFDKLDS
jgi:ribosomal protein S7